MTAGAERARNLFASVNESYWLDTIIDWDNQKVYVDDQNLIKAVEAVLATIPDVVDDEQAVGAGLELVRSEAVRFGGMTLRDVTEAGGGWRSWLNGYENASGSVGHASLFESD